ncbi:helix-turn-helix domain-containing protein [Streptomyces sp. NPDC048436]|uniref:helix-turn-helix domain-containing protein n=1 Tax=Streptomyces sp. NPDC048436 TaxID=3365550 RepID=UPI00371DCE23
MTASDQRPVACANPDCSNTVEQAAQRPGRRRRYCSDRCGRSFRKRQLAAPDLISSKEYATQVAEDCTQALENVYLLAANGQPLAALRALTGYQQVDLKDLFSALVQQARSDKKKSAEIAGAMNTTADKVSRQWKAEENARRRQARLARLQAPRAPLPTRSTALPRQRTAHAAPPPTAQESGGGDTVADPATALGRALSHLQRTKKKSMRMLGEEAGVSASYISRILSGERLPSWRITCRLATALSAAPDELRPLWDEAHGRRPPNPESLAATLRGLVLANARPSIGQLSARTNYSLSPTEISAVLKGEQVPEWEKVTDLVTALHGHPETVRPLWSAATALPDQTPHSRTMPSSLSAGAFG